MPDLLIRALPDDVHRALKRQASIHGRSLQREVQSIFADAARETLSAKATAPSLHASNAPFSARWDGSKSTILADEPLAASATAEVAALASLCGLKALG